MKLIFELVAQDVNVGVELAKQRDALKELNKQLKNVADGSEEQKRLTEQAVKAKLAIADLTEQQKKFNNELKALKVPADSLAGLRLQYSKLAGEIAKLSAAERNSEFGQNLIRNAAKVKKEIDGIEQSIGRFTGNVGNYKSAFDGLFAFVGLGSAIGAATIGMDKFIKTSATVSDKIADVAKAADASQIEIEGLAQSLSQRDTRTSLVDQLGIAEIGGKLGVAKKEIEDFTVSVDVLNVALGDQFGGSAEQTTEVVGKLRNVLVDIKTDKISDDILKIGNALNFLEAQGAASASTTADFASRISGAAIPLGVTSGQIIGLSATLDELGLNAERGATAVNGILKRLAVAPEDFAAAIDVPAAEFKDLVNKDIFGALNLFIGKLNDKNLSNTALSQTLKKLDLDGQGVGEVVGKLGGNMELLSKRVTQAGTALGNTASIQSEFEKKNNTLGASVDKLSNAFNALFTSFSSGGYIQKAIDGFTELTKSVNDFISVPVSDNIIRQQASFNTLVTTLKDVNLEESTRAEIITELQKTYPEYIGNIDLAKASEAELSAVLEQGNKLFEQRIFLQLKEEDLTELTRQEIKLQKELTAQRIASTNAVEDYVDVATGATVSATDQVNNNIEVLKQQLAQLREQKKAITENFDATEKALFGTISATKKAADAQGELDDKTKDTTDTNKLLQGEAKAAAGSLEFLQDRVKKLQEQLEKAPPNQVPKILGDLQKAEKELEAVKNKIEFLKQGGAVAPLDQLTITGEIAPPDLTDLQNTATIDREKELQKTLTAIKINANEEAAKSRAESEKEITKQVEEEEKKRQDIRKAFIQAAFDAAIALTQSIADNETQKVDEVQEEKISALDKEYEEKREAAQGNAQALEAIDKEYQEKKDVIEKEAARERKRIALIESIIAGALATVKALPNIPLVIATGIGAAIQSAIIARQKFAVGGFTGKGLGVDETGERVVSAQLHEGEYVAPRSQVQQFPNLFAALDRMRNKRGASTGIGYAVGGFTEAPAISLSTAQNRAQSNFNIEAEATIKKEDVYFIAQQVAKETYNAVAQGLNDADRTTERKQRLTELTNV